MDRTGLPLPPAAFFILFALAGGEKHGYAIMRETRELSEGDFELGPATLYTTIQRLLDSKWIVEVTGPESGDSRRRYYDLTKQGRDIFDMELTRREAMVRKSKALRLERAEPAQ